MATEARLELTQVGKGFGGTAVLRDVSLQLHAGRILGLVGQNGAGKSTLVKILAGLYPDYTGTIRLDGQAVRLVNPRQARAAGVAVIYQEFSLVPEMTVAENLLLGREPGAWAYSSRSTFRRAAEVIEQVGIEIGVPLNTPVSGLSPAVKQRIEIVKALSEEAKVLLMDEPTARLSRAESQQLFAIMRELSDRGVGVIFISHFLEEVLGITDWVIVLRNGRVVTSAASKELSLPAMTRAMLGEELQEELTGHARELAGHAAGPHGSGHGAMLLEAEDVSAGPRLRNVQLQLRAGQIVGVAGLVGSGRSRLCRVLAGVDTPTSGRLLLREKPVRLRNPQQALLAGIALIPEDRKHQALSLVSSVKDNMAVMALRKKLSAWGVVPMSRVNRLARDYVSRLEVHPANIEAAVGTLSGGNQQKVVVGKALATDPQVLIIDQPTAGVDVGTKAQLHHVLRNLANSGAALLVVSDDLDELYTLSDRLCVMRRGAIIWEGPAESIDRQTLLEKISATSAAMDSAA
jgi:ABC-type sugar transport system ATPase subunit